MSMTDVRGAVISYGISITKIAAYEFLPTGLNIPPSYHPLCFLLFETLLLQYNHHKRFLAAMYLRLSREDNILDKDIDTADGAVKSESNSIVFAYKLS